jgi:hypothetical protein
MDQTYLYVIWYVLALSDRSDFHCFYKYINTPAHYSSAICRMSSLAAFIFWIAAVPLSRRLVPLQFLILILSLHKTGV